MFKLRIGTRSAAQTVHKKLDDNGRAFYATSPEQARVISVKDHFVITTDSWQQALQRFNN